MKTVLSLLLLISLTCRSHALKCHTCVASNEDECNRQGSTACPQYADACSTITGPNTVLKSCTYKSFCEKAYPDWAPSGTHVQVKLECCSGDDCNGPQRSHSHGGRSSAGPLTSSPVLLLAALLALSRL